MTREEFESILEEAYIEGYNTAIEDIQEDILDEEAYDLEDEYDYYTESISAKLRAELQDTYNQKPLQKLKQNDPKGFNLLKKIDIATKAARTNFELSEKHKKDANGFNKIVPGSEYEKRHLERSEQKRKAAERMLNAIKRNTDKLEKHNLIKREKDFLKDN